MVLDLGDRGAKRGMECPHCHVPLSMSSREGIEIDYCPQCRGVWLDRGELDKIIERSAPEAAPEPSKRPAPQRAYGRDRDYDDDDDYKGRKKHKKRKSWIAEIFDELT